MMDTLFIALAGCLVAVVVGEWSTHMENPALYQGDMILSPEQILEMRNGKFQFASTKRSLWPGGSIPYSVDTTIGASSTAMQAIAAAIADYHKFTCLRFKRRTNEVAYINFVTGGGCSSPVGYSGGVNRITLASGCWSKGIVMHEIGHSIGLFHEQSRPDRDNYVAILWNNITPSNMAFNFNKQPTSVVDSLGTAYDYRSMMHYGSNAFGGGKRTIATKDPAMQNEIGRRGGFSQIDIQQINLLYKGRCPVGLRH